MALLTLPLTMRWCCSSAAFCGLSFWGELLARPRLHASELAYCVAACFRFVVLSFTVCKRCVLARLNVSVATWSVGCESWLCLHCQTLCDGVAAVPRFCGLSLCCHNAGELLARSRLHASVFASCAAELHCYVVLKSVGNHCYAIIVIHFKSLLRDDVSSCCCSAALLWLSFFRTPFATR